MYLQVPSHGHTLRPCQSKLAKKQCKLARLMLVILGGSCSFPRIIRNRFPPQEEPQTINQAQNGKIHSSTPLPGGLPKDRRENEPKFYVKRSSEPHFMPGKRYSLPNLPYKYNALEPTISEKIMTLHHDKHHLAYVNGANAALDKLEKARQTGFAEGGCILPPDSFH